MSWLSGYKPKLDEKAAREAKRKKLEEDYRYGQDALKPNIMLKFQLNNYDLKVSSLIIFH